MDEKHMTFGREGGCATKWRADAQLKARPGKGYAGKREEGRGKAGRERT